MLKIRGDRCLALGVFLAVLLVPAAALAQPAPLVDAVGSSGTLAAAALETAGYYYQSYLLDAYMGPMEGSLGALIYIIGAIIAIVVFLGMGQFKFALWFFLGPSLFFSAVVPRTSTEGVDWLWGDEQRSSIQAKHSAEYMAADDKGLTNVQSYTPRISSLFGWYNDLISGTIQEIVAQINRSRIKSDVRFLMRAEMVSHLKTTYVQDPEFKELMQLAMMGHCRAAMEAGREWRQIDPPLKGLDPNVPEPDPTWPLGNVSCLSGEDWSLNPPPDTPAGNQLLCNTGGTATGCGSQDPPALIINSRQCQRKMLYRNLIVKKVQLSDPAWRYLAKLSIAYSDYPGLFDNVLHDPKDVQNILSQMKANQTGGGDNITPAAITDEVASLQRQYGQGLSCQQVWNVTYIGVHRFAMMQTDRIVNQTEKGTEVSGTGTGLTRQEIIDQWNKIAGANPDVDPNLPVNLYKIVAQSILKNELNNPTTSAFIAGFVERSSDFTTIGVQGENDLALTERARVGTREWQEKTQLMNTAATMPYYQGLALYFLSVLYPFFALLLLVPGKHTGFLMWFSLWLWVKSWDIGYAVVMLLDDALFSMMVARNYDNPTLNTALEPVKSMTTIDPAMATAIYTMQEADPTFQLGTYYAIVGIALQSIPIVSSYLLLGSLKGGAGLVSQGIRTVAEFQGVGAAAGSGQSGLNDMRAGALHTVMGAAGAALDNAKSGSYGGSPTGTADWAGVSGGNLRSGNFGGMGLGDSSKGAWGNMFGNPFGNMHSAGLQMSAVQGIAEGFNQAGFLKKTQQLGMDGVSMINRNNMRADRANANRANGGRRGSYTGPSANTTATRNAGKGVGSGGKGSALSRVANVIAKPIETLAGEGVKSMRNIRNADIDKVVAWAKYDAMNSAAVQRRSALGRVYGAIEIPWTIDGGFDQELNSRLTRMQAGFNMASAGVKAVGQAVQGALQNKQDAAEIKSNNR
ncbi:MAG: hypothetical protein KDD66_15990 [Bdellovibrionales bacterium]|nr:hypothetical protein [Bdellovibrionales bacterium]